MQWRVVRLVMMVLGATVAASAQAQDWGNIAIISSTLGNNAGRLCVGEGLRVTDIGCPSYAPYVSATSGFVGLGTVSPTAPLHIFKPNDDAIRINSNLLAGSTSTSLISWFAGGWPNGPGSVRASMGIHSPAGTTFDLVFNTASPNPTYGERMRITGAGNVGIGTTSPNAKLDVYGTISATNLLVNGQPVGGQGDRITSDSTSVIATEDRSVTISTAGTQRVVIGENGNVGIGTVAPSYPLQVSGNAAFTSGLVDLGPNYHRIAATNNSLIFSNASNGQIGFQHGTTRHMTILQAGNVGIATTTPAATLQVSGSFIVSTSAQTTTPSLYVGTNGNVGVGINNPTKKLHVRSYDGNSAIYVENTSNGASDAVLKLQSLQGAVTYGGYGQLTLTRSSEGYAVVPLLALQARAGGQTANLQEWQSSSGVAMSVVDATGNLGIGTTSPSKALDVSGSANISGTVKIAGTGNEACDGASLGTIRFNPVTGAPQICVQR